MSAARFLLCVNGDQGIPTGHVEKIDFMGESGETALELDSCIWPPSDCPRFSRIENAVRISRRKFPILGYRSWVGNWCWDCITVTPAVGADLLNYIKSLGWHCIGGECRFGDMWDRGEKFRPSDVAAAGMTAEELAIRKARREKRSEK